MVRFWKVLNHTVTFISFSSQLQAYYIMENSQFSLFSLILVFQRLLSFICTEQSMYIYTYQQIMNKWRDIDIYIILGYMLSINVMHFGKNEIVPIHTELAGHISRFF